MQKPEFVIEFHKCTSKNWIASLTPNKFDFRRFYSHKVNRSSRDECLNVHWFMLMEDAQDKIDQWRIEYNTFRPHSSLDDMTPEQFEEAYEKEARNSTLELS